MWAANVVTPSVLMARIGTSLDYVGSQRTDVVTPSVSMAHIDTSLDYVGSQRSDTKRVDGWYRCIT